MSSTVSGGDKQQVRHLLSCLPGISAASCCPRTFVHAVPTAWKTLPPEIHVTRPLTLPGLCYGVSLAVPSPVASPTPTPLLQF